jgi:hypothetical protein
MENGPEGSSSASSQASLRASPADGPRRMRRLKGLKDWFFRKPKPAVVRPPPPTVRHQPDPPAVVLSCERCGFDYSITRIEISGKPGVVWTCECGSEFIPPGGPESYDLVRP